MHPEPGPVRGPEGEILGIGRVRDVDEPNPKPGLGRIRARVEHRRLASEHRYAVSHLNLGVLGALVRRRDERGHLRIGGVGDVEDADPARPDMAHIQVVMVAHRLELQLDPVDPAEDSGVGNELGVDGYRFLENRCRSLAKALAPIRLLGRQNLTS
jgi:hypothetical protein